MIYRLSCFYSRDRLHRAAPTRPRLSSAIYGTALFLAVAWSFVVPQCKAQTTAFTYQGRLSDASGPLSGQYDFTFQLFDAPSGGSQVSLTITNAGVAVSNGLISRGP